jgi:hypothetical protein
MPVPFPNMQENQKRQKPCEHLNIRTITSCVSLRIRLPQCACSCDHHRNPIFKNRTLYHPRPEPNLETLKFERADWTLFRTVEGLQQKAGVQSKLLRRLVLKELGDNALDTGTDISFGYVDKDRDIFCVEDDGPGLDGTPEEIAELFSIRRPMRSSKLLRLPQRGALGNGLRVAAGAVLSSQGSLVVITRINGSCCVPSRMDQRALRKSRPLIIPPAPAQRSDSVPACPVTMMIRSAGSTSLLMLSTASPMTGSHHHSGMTALNSMNCCWQRASSQCGA